MAINSLKMYIHKQTTLLSGLIIDYRDEYGFWAVNGFSDEHKQLTKIFCFLVKHGDNEKEVKGKKNKFIEIIREACPDIHITDTETSHDFVWTKEWFNTENENKRKKTIEGSEWASKNRW